MSGTGNGLAVRPNGTPAAHSSNTALAIRGNQSMWDDKQRAALVAMGVSDKATNAELAVFFHQCRNTQLDPFLKQIYLIHRKTKDGDRWVEKPTTQIGIDGFRVIRDRIADKKNLRVEYEDTIWYDGDRNAYDVWIDDEPPAACKVVVLVDGRRFPSVLRFNEYCQFGREDANGNRPRTGRWRDGHAHQIEKCAEADALRKAFPNDMAGLILEDAAPLDDPDAPARMPSDRPRVTADVIRARTPQHVDAEIVDDPDVPPAQAESPSADPATAADAGGTRPYEELLTYISERLAELGVEDAADKLRAVCLIAGVQVKSARGLKHEEAVKVADTLDAIDGPGPDGLLADLATKDDPREVPGVE